MELYNTIPIQSKYAKHSGYKKYYDTSTLAQLPLDYIYMLVVKDYFVQK